MLKKIAAAVGITALLYWITQKVRGKKDDEFAFTELPPDEPPPDPSPEPPSDPA